jgi:acetyltransferase-like isoleucine patch superfamily enzyme
MRHSLNADFLTAAELEAKGVPDAASRNLLIHRTCVIVDFARIHFFTRIHFGRNIRIDPYCIITCAELRLGDHIHISAGTAFTGGGAVTMDDFSTISNQGLIYTSNDDYLGEYLTNPTVPKTYTNVTSADITFGRHAILGARCTVLPSAEISEGAGAGAGSLIKGRLEPWTLYAEVPAKVLRQRSRTCLAFASNLRAKFDA